MDLVDIIIEKKFIGQEFLAWLWFKAETAGTVTFGNGDAVALEIGNSLCLESNTDPVEKVVCSGQEIGMHEVIAALGAGKKPEQAHLILHHQDMKFSFVFIASTFEFRSVALPKTAAADGGEGAETEGMILERIYLVEALVAIMKRLLNAFLVVRVNPAVWSLVAAEIIEWRHSATN